MTREQALAILSKGIKSFRTRKAITQDRLGDILGVTKSNISTMERGKSAPSIECLYTMAEYGMSIEEMFGDEIASRMSRRPEPNNPMEKAQLVKQGLQELLGMINDAK